MKKVILIFLFFFSSTHLSAAEQPWITFSSQDLAQGETTKIKIQFPKAPALCTLEFQKKSLKLFQKNPRIPDYEAYIGVSRTLAPGKYNVTVNYTYESQKITSIPIQLTVKDGKFPYSHITLIGKKKTLSEDSVQLSSEATLIEEKCNTLTPKKLFSSHFIVPTTGTVTTKFGAYRIYNQKKESYRHAGIDIANKKGTLVAAANDGIIILATTLKSHGNTIIIDHGWGIQTLYNHLDSIAVKEGQIVQKDQTIGQMGDSGIATGPHLHWGLSVQGVRVNPATWLSQVKLYN